MAEKFDLGSLLKTTVSQSDTGEERIEYIDLSLIDGDEKNFYELSDIDQLAANIETVGLQQPLRVRTSEEDPGRVVILSGHRRRAALEKLVQEGDGNFQRVPCIRERGSDSPALRELKLIFANSSTRKMTSAELSRQAQRVEDLLVQLREEGHPFPGRMRDHVAQACQVSATRLANLKVIRENLIAEAKEAWEAGELSEDAALKLARLPFQRQQKICEAYKSRQQGRLRWMYSNEISAYEEKLKALDGLECSLFGGKCENTERKWERLASCSAYDSGSCARSCCALCENLASCKHACPRLSSEIAAARQARKEDAARARAEKEERERPDRELLAELWARFRNAREQAGVSVESLFGPNCWNVQHSSLYVRDFQRMEAGNLSITDGAPFSPLELELTNVRRLRQLAGHLDCSLDYLFCMSDEPDPKQITLGADLSEPEPYWRTGAPPEGRRVLGRFDLGEGLGATLSCVYVSGGKYYLGKRRDLDYDLPLLGWLPLPEEE